MATLGFAVQQTNKLHNAKTFLFKYNKQNSSIQDEIFFNIRLLKRTKKFVMQDLCVIGSSEKDHYPTPCCLGRISYTLICKWGQI